VFWLGPLIGATLATVTFEAIIRPPEQMVALEPENIKSNLNDGFSDSNHKAGRPAYDDSRV
jgi:hypothetical protein